VPITVLVVEDTEGIKPDPEPLVIGFTTQWKDLGEKKKNLTNKYV